MTDRPLDATDVAYHANVASSAAACIYWADDPSVISLLSGKLDRAVADLLRAKAALDAAMSEGAAS